MAWWNLHPPGEGEGKYGTPEVDDHEAMDNTHAAFSDTYGSRDYPTGDSGPNFIWRLIVFPFHVFGTITGRHDPKKIGIDINGHAPVLGMVGEKAMRKKGRAISGSNDEADQIIAGAEYYDSKFKSRGKSRR